MAEKNLLELLDAINLDKNTNLLPETLKDGVTCLGVEGATKPLSITEDATATANDLASGVTAYINNEKVTGTINTVSDGIAGGFPNEIRDDSVLNALVVETKANVDTLIRTDAALQTNVEYSKLTTEIGLTADKIIEGNTILGIEGTGTTGVDTSDATAIASDIAEGKTAYTNGEKVEGTLVEYEDGMIYAEKIYGSSTHTEELEGGYIDIVSIHTFKSDAIYRKGSAAETRVSPKAVADAIDLTSDMIVKGYTVLEVEGTAEVEDGTKTYATLEELQAVTGTEGQFAIVYDGTIFDGAYLYTGGAWVEQFSSRRYEGTITPEEYTTATTTASNILGE